MQLGSLQYELKAHSIYITALYQWLENNQEAYSVPVVSRLVKEYEAKGVDDLKRYHVRASKAPDERSTATMSSLSTASSSNCTSVVSLNFVCLLTPN